jgi:2-C-methyl-D-erythritol 2,4-cyclodiphosphate synthase
MRLLFGRHLQLVSLAAGRSALFRIGFGYDAHRLVEGRPLILGGVHVPHPFGLQGHSDADVLTHAVIDALLGALCLGDMGQHFPDSDPAYKNADSLMLLAKVVRRVKQEGYRVNQMDSTIVAEKPRLAPHIAAMEQRLSGTLEVPPGRVSVKAKTSENMGFCGREEGIEAFAILSLIGEILCP